MSKLIKTETVYFYDDEPVVDPPTPAPPPVIDPPAPTPPPTPEPPISEGRTHTINIPRGLLGRKNNSGVPMETALLREIEDLREGDLVRYIMEPGLHKGGWFEVNPPVKIRTQIVGNNCELDTSDGRMDEHGNETVYLTGIESRGAIALTTNVLSLNISEMTIRGYRSKANRCISVSGQECVNIDDVQFYPPAHGIQGECSELNVTNSKFFAAGNRGTGMEHAIYIKCDLAMIAGNDIESDSGHCIKLFCPDALISGNVLTEGLNATGAAINPHGGHGVCRVRNNVIRQQDTERRGNRAIFSLSGNSRWIGGGQFVLSGNKIIDEDPLSSMPKIIQHITTEGAAPMTVTLEDGNTYNGGPLVV